MATQTVENLPVVGLRREHYLSPEHFELELERLFRRRWLFACYESQLRGPGDCVRVDVGGDSLIVVRGDDGTISALHNLCRHRGSVLVTEERGRCKAALVCPYHGWSYRFDGSLRATPRMRGEIDRDGLGLKPAWVDVWQGLVFVSLAAGRPAAVAAQLDRVDFSAYDLERTKVAWDAEHVIEANWKIVWENGSSATTARSTTPSCGACCPSTSSATS